MIISVWVILYGPLDLAQPIGYFASECEINLQDPICPVVDVIYKNPHLLTYPGEQIVKTSSILRQDIAQTVEALDIEKQVEMDELFPELAGVELAETDTPTEILTPLYRYISYQFV